MRITLGIMKTELKVLFFSPIAWILLIVFTFQAGLQYCETLSDLMRNQSLGYSLFGISTRLIGGSSGLVARMLSTLYLYIPLLTMGLMSRELGSGSIKLLYSSPVSNSQIIFGKYLAAIVYSLLLAAVVMIPTAYSMVVVKDADIPAMLTAVLGMLLIISAYAAIGLFMSTITKNQVVAAVGTLALLAVLNFIGNVGQDMDFVRDITYWLSIRGRSEVFTSGMLCTKDILYFLLIIAFFLSLSIIKLRGERLKLSRWNTITKYALAVIALFGLGYISSRPQFTVYRDVTATKINTLTPASQQVMERIEGKITVTSYVNYLDNSWLTGSPGSRNWDLRKFERYVRFRPDMKFRYVYYWGEGNDPGFESRYPELTTEELFHKKIEVYDSHSPRMFISEKEITDDISQDHGRFVRVIRAGNGRVAYLREYDDASRQPSEAEITAAFKTLVDRSPVVAFVTGHGERGVEDYGERGYAPFATDVRFRYALVNQGFTVREIGLDKPVADDVDVVVISDMRSSLSNREMTNFESYVDRGGNLLLLGEPRRQEQMNPLAAKLGLRLSKGVIVSPSDEYTDDVVACSIAPAAVAASQYFSRMAARGKVITPSACAVEQLEDNGFKVAEVLVSPESGSWIEYQTADFADTQSTIDRGTGEKEMSHPVMLYLNRKVGGRDQRIFVAGDSDCLSTAELTAERPGLRADNFGMITEIFRNFSYGEYPVETPRVRQPDNRINVSDNSAGWIKAMFIWALPSLLLVSYVLIWFRRRGR